MTGDAAETFIADRSLSDERVEEALIAEIDRVLWEIWDPIGVNDSPEARDEYHSYIHDVYALLKAAATREEIAAHLTRVERERMGLSDCGLTASAAADHLLEIDLGA